MRIGESSSTDEDAAFREVVKGGIASAESARIVAYEAIRRWILSWGTESELEPPTCK